MPAEWWKHLAPDMAAFCRDWASTAIEKGWSTLDLFGAHPRTPHTRFEYMGLVLLLQGERVTQLTSAWAKLEGRMKLPSIVGRLTTVPADAVPVWEIGGGALTGSADGL